MVLAWLGLLQVTATSRQRRRANENVLRVSSNSHFYRHPQPLVPLHDVAQFAGVSISKLQGQCFLGKCRRQSGPSSAACTSLWGSSCLDHGRDCPAGLLSTADRRSTPTLGDQAPIPLAAAAAFLAASCPAPDIS